MELHKMYRPITATPFKCCENYMEFEPCDALKPYIRCFWGTRRPVRPEKGIAAAAEIVTPDTCMDIIFTVDFTYNKIESLFCGIDDRPFVIHSDTEEKTFFVFAIRFYAWGVPMFAEESMRNTKNGFFDAGFHFPRIKKEIEKRLFEVTDIYQWIPMMEKLLIKCFHDKYRNKSVFQAVSKILENKGNLSIAELKQDILVSSRQLERLFSEYVGCSPKSLASMVRYQYLWSDFIHHKEFDILDAVYKYGYSDQTHLCHDFKKYHSMSLAEAKKYTMQNVENIQDVYFGL